MSMRSRLVLIIVTFILVSGCGDSNQPPSTQHPQVVRRKIVAEASTSVNTQKNSTSPDTSISSSDPAAELLDLKNDAVEYQYQGRVDPFMPLIKEEKDQPAKDEPADKSKRKNRIPQTPLEKIDLTQLKLTAIFKEKNNIKGLVEEPAGKGYIVSNGTYVGLDGGQITKMLKDRIVITEQSTDVMGKPVTIEHELKLRLSSGE